MSNDLKDSYYYLRSLPLFAAALLFFIFLRTTPELVRDLNEYILSGPEENFGRYGWSLYFIIIPFCIAGLSRARYHWPMMIGLLLAPVVLCFSYWLWELLGWVVMGFYLVGLYTMIVISEKRREKEHDIHEWLVLITCIIYAILRIIGGLGNGALLGWADMGLIVVLGGYFVVTAIVDCFKYGYYEDVKPATVSFVYVLVIPVLMLLMAGSYGRSRSISFGAGYKQQKELIRKAEAAEDRGAYRDAARYYTEAAAIRSKANNERLAAAMNHKADSIESLLVREIPANLSALKREKRTSRTFDTHANEIEHEIILLEKNASCATAPSTIASYKDQLENQRKRKR